MTEEKGREKLPGGEKAYVEPPVSINPPIMPELEPEQEDG